MSFVRVNGNIGAALEKGLSSAIKAADIRFTSHGLDNKKKTADDLSIGAVSYVTLNDPKNEDPALAKIGSVTKIYCSRHDDSNWYDIENTANVADAVVAARAWVETFTGASMAALNALTVS